MVPKTSKRNIGIWAEHPFQLYSVMEFLNSNKFLEDDKITIITKKANLKVVEDIRFFDNYEFFIIETIHKSWHSSLRDLVEAILVPDNFSRIYDYNNNLRVNVFYPILLLQRYLPKSRDIQSINRKATRFFNAVISLTSHREKVFDCIYCFTKVYYSLSLHIL